MIYEAETWVLIVLAVGMGAALIAMTRVRALFAIAALFAALMIAAGIALMALDAPDLALTQTVFALVVAAPLFLGAASLAARAAATPRKARWLAPAVALAAAVLLCLAAPDLPAFGQKGPDALGAIYVNRAAGEAGMLNAVSAIAVNYRAIDSLLAAGALFIAALGAYAILGFGERSVLRRPAPVLDDENGGGG